MKKILSALLIVTLMISSLLAFSSCGKEDDGAQISVYLTDRVYSFDPAANEIDDAVISILYLVYEPLFALKDNGNVEKAMVKSYKWDKDTGNLQIELKESYWSNGSRVAASDFVYAWQRIVDPANSFFCASLLYDVKNAYAIKTSQPGYTVDDLGIKASSISTLEIEFEREVNHKAILRTFANIALAPVNRDTILNQETYWHSATSASACYTNGPFRIKDLDNAMGYFTLARNDGYHRKEDSKRAVDYFVVPEMIRTVWSLTEVDTALEDEVANMEALYELMSVKAQNTVFYMSSLSLADRKTAKKVKVNDNLSTYTYVLDNSNPLFSNSEVRTILSEVLDRNYIVSLITYGKAATGLVSDGVWNTTSKRDSKSFRSQGGSLISTSATLTIDQAKNQLNQLGATRGAFTLTYEEREEDQAVAEYIKSVWDQLGYTVELQPVSYFVVQVETGGVDNAGNKIYSKYHVSALSTIYAQGNYDVIAIDYQMYSTNALTALAQLSYTASGCGVDTASYNLSTDANKNISDYINPNMANYKNVQYDELIVKAIETSDLNERASYLHQAEELLIEDMPVIPLYFNQSYYVANSALRRLSVNYFGFTNFTDAKLYGYKKHFFED